MFRLTQLLHHLTSPGPLPRRSNTPVVVWNLIRRCNLLCRHCYSASSDKDFSGELSTREVISVLSDLQSFGVRAIILSGGEPLLRPDIFEIIEEAKSRNFHTGLSTNGTLITPQLAQHIASARLDYVGISIDGMETTHDHVRGKTGAFKASINGLHALENANVRAGLRFTLTQDNAPDLPALLNLMLTENVQRLYFSHLNFSGRGKAGDQAAHRHTREAMTTLFNTAWQDLQEGKPREFVTGNNDADGVFFLNWIRDNWKEKEEETVKWLTAWGGNASGQGIANIDNQGNVHPDIFWGHHTLGNVRETPFSTIWQNHEDPVLAKLRQHPRPVTGRCGSCHYLNICNGNTRVRAHQASHDPWAEDPGCYLTESEIALPPS